MSDVLRLGELSAVKLALMARKVRAEAREVLQADPIAVVGLACRVPGGGDSPERFWSLLRDGVDAIRPVPGDRWDNAAWFDPDPAAPGKSMAREGGFIDGIDQFDAGYFGVVPREAERMDPQQRVLLEVAIEALEDAGLTRERLAGSRTGVYIASYHNDYAHLEYSDAAHIDARTLTGTVHSVVANRLSYFLDLRGPSVSIDTACSSSLVAIHLACQSLRMGECDVAVAGGVSLMITPGLMVSLSKVGFMAPDGRCKTFDATANGFGRGEGCGVIVCKRLAEAIADGDRVLAVVRGSAVNQDGHSTLLAAPNGLAQQAMIVEALGNAQLEPARIGFIEAHGTGTALGDPIEVEALAATVGRPFAGAGPCYLGASKANLGHLEAAAGVVGVIKTVLCLQHEAIPPQVHFHHLSPHISLEGSRMVIPTALTPWPAGEVPRCAAVSGFGVGGTNAHVVVEEAPRLPASREAIRDFARVLPLSAQSPGALRALAESWVAFLADSAAPLIDLIHTAGERRTHLEHRLAVVGRTKEELRARLQEQLARESEAVSAAAPPKVALVFSGQGPQWHAMGRELLASEPVFRDVITECDRLLRPLSGWSLLDELGADEAGSRLAETEVAQPALFALQVALAALWRSWGIVPDAVVGHSIGELAALHVAGVLPLPEAVRVVWHRGHIMQQAMGLGRMAQVSLTEEEALAVARAHDQRLSVGAINGPRGVVLSGDAEALDEALAELDARGVSHRLLPVQYAFHSAQMAPFEARLRDELGTVATAAPAVEVYSTVTGGRATDARFDAAYFGRNVRAPVRFAAAIGALAADGHDVFLEVGPHPVLSASITDCLDAAAKRAQVLASLRRQRPERETLLQACAALHVAGGRLDWAALNAAPGQVTSLPAYPWQRKRYWIRTRPEAPPSASRVHPLLGRRVPAAAVHGQLFEGGPEASQRWLPDHRIFGRVLLPAAAILEAFLAAARLALGGAARLAGLAVHRPLVVPPAGEGTARWQTVVTPNGTAVELELHEAVAGDPGWRKVASATATRDRGAAMSLLARDASEAIESAAVYQRFSSLGIDFGPTFRRLEEVRLGPGVAEASLTLPGELAGEYALHPVLLDAGLQLCALAAGPGAGGELPAAVMLPIGADGYRVRGPVPARLRARARLREAGAGGTITADLEFASEDGTVVAAVEGMRFARAEARAFAAPADEGLYEIGWRRAPAAAASESVTGTWLILADGTGLGERLARALAASGGAARLVRAGTGFAKPGDTFTVNPADPEHLRGVLAEVGPLRGVVHLWSLDLPPFETGVSGDEDLLTSGALLHLVQALAAAGASPPLFTVTRGAQVVTGDEPATALRPRAAASWGLASVIAVEHPELRVRRIDLDPSASDDAEALLSELRAGPASVALRGHERFTPVLERHRPSDARPLRLTLERAGTLDGVALRAIERSALAADHLRVAVAAAGINFRDVLVTLGMYPGAAPVPLGAECMGVVTEVGSDVRGFAVGHRVFGFAPGSLATEVDAPAAFLAPAPAGLTDEEIAALPVAFLTAWRGLHQLADLRAGERVLIHAAAGGVGLAAVQLARRCGAEVFATAGSDEKRAYLRRLGVAHVMDSRSLAFADEIRTITGGAGVHVVLNALAGDFIRASLGVLAPNGRFLELGKRDILTPEEAATARPDVRYLPYDLGTDAFADRSLLRPMLDEIVAALADGSLRPLPVTVRPLEKTSEAFRFMAMARHIGKLVVRAPARAGLATRPLVHGDATYWITGGLGGLGLHTARWLAEAGARSIVLSGRRPPSPEATAAIAALEARGVTVRVFAVDAGDRAQMAAALDEIRRTLPPLRGVIHGAGLVDDAVLLHQRWERFGPVLRGKAEGAFVLHELTRALPLDFFVLYGAAGLFLGAPGQGAYPAANAQLDALAQARRRAGLPALSVAWGAWADAGMAAALAARGNDVWAARGLGKIDPVIGFAGLERLLRDGATTGAVLPIDWSRFLAQLPTGSDNNFFAAVAPEGRAVAPVSAGAAVVARLQALPPAQQRPALVAYLAERALEVLGLDAATPVDPRVPLKELGLDSLMSVELRNALARTLGRPLPATLLFDYPTVDGLGAHLAGVLSLGQDEPPASRPDAATEIASLSDAEAEALLLQELEGGPGRAHGGSTLGD